MKLFNLKGNVKRQDIFRESILLCFLKIGMSLKETCSIVCLETPFSKSSYHIETSQLIALQINWPFSIYYDFLLKKYFRTDFSYSHRINCRIIFPTLVRVSSDMTQHTHNMKVSCNRTSNRKSYTHMTQLKF